MSLMSLAQWKGLSQPERVLESRATGKQQIFKGRVHTGVNIDPELYSCTSQLYLWMSSTFSSLCGVETVQIEEKATLQLLHMRGGLSCEVRLVL